MQTHHTWSRLLGFPDTAKYLVMSMLTGLLKPPHTFLHLVSNSQHSHIYFRKQEQRYLNNGTRLGFRQCQQVYLHQPIVFHHHYHPKRTSKIRRGNCLDDLSQGKVRTKNKTCSTGKCESSLDSPKEYHLFPFLVQVHFIVAISYFTRSDDQLVPILHDTMIIRHEFRCENDILHPSRCCSHWALQGT